MSYVMMKVQDSTITVVTFNPSNDEGKMDIHTEWTDEITGELIGHAPTRTLSKVIARKMYRHNLLSGFYKL